MFEGKRGEFVQAMELFCDAGPEAGCAGYGAYEDLAQPGRFLWTEQWTNREALEAHLASERHHLLLGAIRVLGRLESVNLVEYKPGDGAA